MTQTFEQWSPPTKQIFNGVLIFSIAGILNAIFSFINVTFFLGLLFWVGYIFTLAIVVGYILYVMGLGNFKKILEPADSAAAGKVYIAAILSLIAAVLGIIPVAGAILGGILGLVGYILMLMGFSALKNSQTLPEMARKGASTIFLSLILLLAMVIWFIHSIIVSTQFLCSRTNKLKYLIITNISLCE